LAAVQAGTAGAPIGKPLLASEVPLRESRVDAAVNEEDTEAL
jgi:penicillin-binding protein 2